jgi:hypothetical protein
MQGGVVHREVMKRMVKPPLNANKVWNIDGKVQQMWRISIFGTHLCFSQSFNSSGEIIFNV